MSAKEQEYLRTQVAILHARLTDMVRLFDEHPSAEGGLDQVDDVLERARAALKITQPIAKFHQQQMVEAVKIELANHIQQALEGWTPE